jgi:hypothetical protein
LGGGGGCFRVWTVSLDRQELTEYLVERRWFVFGGEGVFGREGERGGGGGREMREDVFELFV